MLGSSEAIRGKRWLAETELLRGTGLFHTPCRSRKHRAFTQEGQVMPIYKKKQLHPGPTTARTQREQAMPRAGPKHQCFRDPQTSVGVSVMAFHQSRLPVREYKLECGASKMAQPSWALAAKPDDLSFIPGPDAVGGENRLLQDIP